MSALVLRRGARYLLRVWVDDTPAFDALLTTAQEAADFLATHYPGIVCRWNI